MNQIKRSKKKIGSRLGTGSLIVLFMLIIPYAFYIYKYFPNEPTFEFLGWTFSSKYYDSVRYFMYDVFAKLTPLSLLLIWFTTCKHWWYYSIAIPISIYIFQLTSILNDGVVFIDEYEFIYSLPITLIILAILYFIRSKLGVFLKAKDIKKEMDEQMNRPFVRKGE